jgi:hypothetical protein
VLGVRGAMATDNTFQVERQAQDDASEAYLAGDLEALIGLMTGEQGFCFKQAMVRQAVHHVEGVMPPEEEDEGESSGVEFARRWLEQPTDENAYAAGAYAYFDAMDGGVRNHDYPKLYNEPAWAAAYDDLALVANTALRTAPAGQEVAARQWQVEAAWAILQSRELPALT